MIQRFEDLFKKSMEKPFSPDVNEENTAEWIEVENVPDTSDEDGGWCRRWEEYKGVHISCDMRCSVKGCNTPMNSRQKCGAHLKVIDKRFDDMYGKVFIAPICKSDNHHTNTDPFWVLKNRLVLKDKLE